MATRNKQCVTLIIRTDHALGQVRLLVLRVRGQISKVTEGSHVVEISGEEIIIVV